MTAKEKATEVFNNMCNSVDELLPLDVKECAIKAVDEIINELYECGEKNRWEYWQQVKQEIEKL